MTDSDFKNIFPFEKPRNNQREIIERIIAAFDSGKKYVILNAPTGIGKSAIGFSIARWLGSSFILTSQKVLQEQYFKDFKIPFVLGRVNYRCQKNQSMTCELGACLNNAKNRCIATINGRKQITCPYLVAKENCMSSPHSNLNYSYYLALIGSALDNEIKRNLIVCDECIRGNQLVKTKDGNKQIKDIKIGDLVYSYNITTKTYEYKEVEKIHKNLMKSNSYNYFLKIELENGIVLEVTPNHKIFTTNRGYVRADQLTENDDIFINKNVDTQFRKDVIGMKDKTIKICELCKASVINLAQHLVHRHKFTFDDQKKYFDTYIEPFDHKCPNCNKPLKFKSFGSGYVKYCSQSCQIKYLIKTENINIHIFNSEYLKNPNNVKKLKEGLHKFYESDRGKQFCKNRSIRQMGDNNTCHRMSKETKLASNKKQSIKMKQLIAEGKFTPCITNSWANSKCCLQIQGFDKYYRSSWDAAFQILNPDFKYEELRIPYIGLDNKLHNYIVDFINEEKKILIEIKPISCINYENNKIKEKAAQKWCIENEYEYKIISNDYFKINAKKIDFSLYDNKIYIGMKQFL